MEVKMLQQMQSIRNKASGQASSMELFLREAKAAGCTAQQMRNFLRANYVPQPKQLEFHGQARAADRKSGPDEIGFGGARGPGKSHAIFAQLALDDCQRVADLKCLYVRQIGKKAREQLEDLRKSVLHTTPHTYNRNEGIVKFGNGSRIIVGHFKDEREIDGYLGLEYDVIAIEETTTLSLAKYKALRDSNRTSKPNWRPRIYNSTNPGGIGHAWYKERFILPKRENRQKWTVFIPATLDDNKMVDEGYKRKLEENTGWKLKAYRYGDWDIGAGAFFTNFDSNKHVISSQNIPSTAGWRLWASLDYGFTHYTVVYLIGESTTGELYVLDEHAERNWLVPQHARAIKDMLRRNRCTVDSLYTFVAGQDIWQNKGSALTIAEQYASEGIRLKKATVNRIDGAAEILQRLGNAAAGVPPRLFIVDRCRMLVRTLPEMMHDPNRPEDVLKTDADADGNGGDDAYDAMRYGVMVARQRKKGIHVLK